MAQNTPKLGLTKPVATDKISPTVIADDMDILDNAQIVKSYTITINSTGVNQVIAISPADYIANGRSAHLRLRFRRINPTSASQRHEFIADVIFSGSNPEYHIVNSLGGSFEDSGVYSIRILAPKSDTYGCSVDVKGYSATARTVMMDVLESDVQYTVDTTPSTSVYNSSSYNFATADVGRYNVGFSSNPFYCDITGRAASTYDGILNDRFKYGEAPEVSKRLCAVGTDGLVYKLSTTTTEFRLPITLGLNDGVPTPSTTYGTVWRTIRGMLLTILSNQGFTLPTLAIGDDLYVRGSLNNGSFVPDGTITTSMTAGYTFVRFGRVEWLNSETPEYFTFNGYEARAYTLDANGKLTHIDGLQIA